MAGLVGLPNFAYGAAHGPVSLLELAAGRTASPHQEEVDEQSPLNMVLNAMPVERIN